MHLLKVLIEGHDSRSFRIFDELEESNEFLPGNFPAFLPVPET